MSRSAAKCAETTQRIQTATGNPAVEWIAADLSTLAGVNEAADEFLARHGSLHVLVNNAGGVFADRQVTADGYEMTFALNHLNYFLLDPAPVGHARCQRSGAHRQCLFRRALLRQDEL